MLGKINRAYWPYVLNDLKSVVAQFEFDAWFKTIKFGEESKNDKIVLITPTQIARELLENRFGKVIKEKINDYYPKAKVVFVSDEIIAIPVNDFLGNVVASDIFSNMQKVDENNQKKVLNFSKHEPIETKSNYSSLPKKSIHGLNSKFTFETLVNSSHIELGISVAKAIIKQPGTLYNPVFIHSGTGLGKTHLLQAIGNKLIEEQPNFQIRYINSETFMNHYTTSMQKGQIIDFKNYYRDIDILLIDDIQFLASKQGTQDTFFHTFESLHQNNKQIVVSSDKSPKLLGGFEERLLSRFEWGMVLELPQPNLEDRMAIIKDKAARIAVPLIESQVFQVAAKIQTNVRDIEGALNKIRAATALNPGNLISDEALDNILHPWIGVVNQGIMQFSVSSNPNSLNASTLVEPVKEISPPTISAPIINATTDREVNLQIKQICKLKNVTLDQILGNSRTPKINEARGLIIYLLKDFYHLSFHEIAKLMGGKSHTTMMYNYKKILASLNNNIETKEMLEAFQPSVKLL